ncbi:MAG TPA: hypothetical protein VMU00_07895 [Steroidobacteraceae bacterium]|nr:hypothetical protein [Steroidobacteraceae bacterium]
MASILLRALCSAALALAAAAALATDPSASLWLAKARELGFRPESHDGKAIYCRTYVPVGSHLSVHECLSEADLIAKLSLERPGPSLRVVSGPAAHW